MRNVLKKLVFGLGLTTCGSSPSLAGTPGLTNVPATISTVFTRDIGMDIYTGATSNPMGCSMANVFRIQPTVANSSAIVSTTLSAFMAHKSVSFWVSACDSDGASIVLGVVMNYN